MEKGSKMTKEHKRKIGESNKGKNKGKKYPKELYPNYGNRGKSSWCKGLTKKTDKRVAKKAKAQEGKKHSKERCKAISKANEGKKHTKEAKKKISMAVIGAKNPFYGKHHSQETKDKISKANKGRKLTEEHKKKITEGLLKRNYHHSEETKRKIKEGELGKCYTLKQKENLKKVRNAPEAKKLYSKANKKKWANPEFQKAWQKGINAKPNKPEQLFDEKTPEIVRYVGDGQFFITTKIRTHNPDFKVKGEKKIIELWGRYWHYQRYIDQGLIPPTKEEVIAEYAAIGWECLIFWIEDEFYIDTEQVLKETLEFIKR